MLPPHGSALDRYGHLLSNLTKEEAATRTALITSEAMKARAWTNADPAAYPAKKLKQLVRDGVPPNLRLRVWLHLSGANLLRAEQADGYFASLQARTVPKPYVLEVEAAILRSLPGHHLLSTPFGLQSVVTVVHTYHLHTGLLLRQPVICIAAFLVSILGLCREEDCFWILVGLLGNIMPPNFVEDAQQGTLVEHLVLQQLLKKRATKLVAAFDAMDHSLEELAGPWFSHLFCGTLPAETVVRVWDCLFLEGPKILFRVALALLKREEAVVLGNPQKLRNIQWRISRTFNADALLKMAFKGIGSLPSAAVQAARREVEVSVLQGKTSQVKRLEALLCPSRVSPQPSTTSSGLSELSTIVEVAEISSEAPRVSPAMPAVTCA